MEASARESEHAWKGRRTTHSNMKTYSSCHGISVRMSNSRFLPVFLFSLISILLTVSVQLAEAEYPQQFLDSVEVCTAESWGKYSSLAKKKIRLANFPNNTVSVKITRWDALYASFYDYRCRFQVIAPKGMGVMAVIQSMHLRTMDHRLSCRDYVQFQQDSGIKTSQICGVVQKHDTAKVPERIIGPRKFFDPKGDMGVAFFTDERGNNTDFEVPISLHLIFTAYKECTPTAVNSNLVRSCSSLRSHSCISSHLFCDGVINCAFDEEFGSDESDCGVKARDVNGVDRTVSIYVFVITTVATLVIVVILALIVCCCLQKFAKQRRSDHHQERLGALHPHHLHQIHSQQSMMGPDVIRMDNTGPSAPLRSTEPSPEKYPVVEIDQPPPYDVLFPSSKPVSTKPSKKQ